MHISRVTALTLGVSDLAAATTFYETVFGVKRLPEHEGIAFFTLPGVWLMLYPLAALAADISPDLSPQRGGFSGITLAHNARSREEVLAIFDRVAAAGARIVKPPSQAIAARSRARPAAVWRSSRGSSIRRSSRPRVGAAAGRIRCRRRGISVRPCTTRSAAATGSPTATTASG